eukprot:s1155_g11.t1
MERKVGAGLCRKQSGRKSTTNKQDKKAPDARDRFHMTAFGSFPTALWSCPMTFGFTALLTSSMEKNGGRA